MLGSSDVMATVAVKDIQAAREFYENTLGLTVESEMPEAALVVYRSGDSQIQVYQSENAGTNKATAATWTVSDVAGISQALRDKGVAFERYPDMPGVQMEGDVHVWDDQKVAWFRDGDDNILCIHSQE